MSGTSDLAGDQGWQKVGSELRRLRTEQGLSLAEAGRRVHYTKGYLSKIETGKRRNESLQSWPAAWTRCWEPVVCWRTCWPPLSARYRYRWRSRRGARSAHIQGWPRSVPIRPSGFLVGIRSPAVWSASWTSGSLAVGCWRWWLPPGRGSLRCWLRV
ncbi:MAG: helix-turn-helix transcriptional regulator [Pseudonocardia sp.]|nr:helix-turn-helix transcriptional regulator [Pseudonocardia sp.]